MKIMSNPPAYLRREDYNFLSCLENSMYCTKQHKKKKKKKENNNLTELGNQEQINYKF